MSAVPEVIEILVPAAWTSATQVFEYENLGAFPATGRPERIYVAKDSRKIYHWSLSPSPGEYKVLSPIDALESGLSSLGSALTLEAQTRNNADTLEAETRFNADTLEAQTRNNADTLEAQTRNNADTLEAETRFNADTLLGSQIDSLETALSSETTARTNADTLLGDRIDTLESTVSELGPNDIGAQPAGSYATLVGGTVPSSQLPSYVDDVIEYQDLQTLIDDDINGNLPGKIYVTLDNNKIYRWSGSSHIEISPSPGSTDAVAEGTNNLYFKNARASAAAPVQSVAGKTGAVTLNGDDVRTSAPFTVTNVSQGAYSNGSVIAAGTSLETVIKSMLQTFQAPTVSISAGSGLSLAIELGSNYSGTINRNFAQNNGGSVTGYRLQLNDADNQTGVSLPANFSVSENQVTTDRQWKLFVDYAANAPVNAGTASSGLLKISPVRRSFFGADTQTTAVTDSAGVRGLTAGAGSTGNVLGLTNGATYNLKIPAGTKRVTIAYPATLQDITSIAYEEAGNAAVLDTFSKSVASATGQQIPHIQVNNAAGQSPIDYRIYTYITQAGFESAATYKITI